MARDRAKLQQYVSMSFVQSLMRYPQIYAEPVTAPCWSSASQELCDARSWLGLISAVNALAGWAVLKLAPTWPASIFTFQKPTKREGELQKSSRGVAIRAQFRHSNG